MRASSEVPLVLPAELSIRRVDRSQDAVLRNLLQHSCHDMAEGRFREAARDAGDRRWPYFTFDSAAVSPHL